MMKKFLWLSLTLGLVVFGIFWKFYYPGSQLEMRHIFKNIEATPIRYYYEAQEPSCGIWYENPDNADSPVGKNNNAVKACFTEAFTACVPKNILIVKHDETFTLYSLIRILRSNDLDDCIIQNYHETQADFDQTLEPISYINTCTALSENFYDSCEPKYIRDLKKKQKASEKNNQ